MGKHIQEANLKTIGGESLVGKSDLDVVKVDGKTISKNDQGQLKLGNQKGEIITKSLIIKGESSTDPQMIIEPKPLTVKPVNNAIERDENGKLYTVNNRVRYPLVENDANVPINYAEDLSSVYTPRSLPDLEYVSSIVDGYQIYRKPNNVNTGAYVRGINTSTVLFSPHLKIRGLKKTKSPSYPYMIGKIKALLAVYQLGYSKSTSSVAPLSCKFEVQLVPSNPDLISLQVGREKVEYVTLLSGSMSNEEEDIVGFETYINSKRADHSVKYRQLEIDSTLNLKVVSLVNFKLVEKEGTKSFPLDWNSDDYGLDCRVMIKIDYADAENVEGKNATTYEGITSMNLVKIDSLHLIDVI